MLPDVVIARSGRWIPYGAVAQEPVAPNLNFFNLFHFSYSKNLYKTIYTVYIFVLYLTLMAGRMICRSSPNSRLLAVWLLLVVSSCSLSIALHRSSKMLNISSETMRAHSCHADRHPSAIRASKFKFNNCVKFSLSICSTTIVIIIKTPFRIVQDA